jgi:hypothetical protein
VQAPAGQLAHDGPESDAVGRQLVDLGGSRWRQAALDDDLTRLEILQARRQDVGADPRQRVGEVGVALGALQQLADDQQRPALADQLERVGDGAVLLELLAMRAV